MSFTPPLHPDSPLPGVRVVVRVAAAAAYRTAVLICEAPRAETGVWDIFEKSDKLIEIDPNGFGLDAVLFWASGTQ